uniref:Ribosome biogenesis protein BRX1 homolog n=1 Tax=Salarias fasciatus TaxID=181472 RepID=A0A672I2T9_SALFA
MAAYKRKRGLSGLADKKAKKVKFVADGDEEEQDENNEITVVPPVSMGKWTNKERVLIFSSRGINFRTRHLMQDLRTMMPHSKADTKMDRKDKLLVINEVCEIKNCNKCLFFEAKKKQDLYMWISNSPHGPSAKFLVQNIHTLAELKMTGNCLKGSRPLLSFDPKFDSEPHYALLKELFIQTFSTPRYHPKSQPFVDHVLTFTIADNRIWFRNYQIIEEDASLVEVGPRFVLNLIKIFQGSFGGPTLYENPNFKSPNMVTWGACCSSHVIHLVDSTFLTRVICLLIPAPAHAPTGNGSQSARKADGEGYSQGEEEGSEGGSDQGRDRRRLPDAGRGEARSHSDRSAAAEAGEEEQTQSFQKTTDAKEVNSLEDAEWSDRPAEFELQLNIMSFVQIDAKPSCM